MQKNRIIIVLLVTLCACATAVKVSTDREPSSTAAGAIEVPPGLLGDDAADYEHLSEGSDIYPYEWIRVLRSANFKDSDGEIKKPFLQDLDQRFGIMPSSHQGRFMIPYVGLSAAWSNHRPEASDAFKGDTTSPVRYVDANGAPVDGRKCVQSNCIRSIRLVGTNCTLCHTGGVRRSDGKIYQLGGAPNAANIRGYFQDLAQSTVAVLADGALAEQFLTDLHVGNAKVQAKKIHDQFWTELADETGINFRSKLGAFGSFVDNNSLKRKISTIRTLLQAKEGNTTRYYKGKKAIANALTKLLRVTYGFSDTDNIGELEARMGFLGTLMVGTDPKTAETPSGWGRTDAFGRIGNLVLRGDHPIDYTSPVSLPWIWGIKYQAMLHYTANTNSVILRNVGQSLGLGAIILDGQMSSTVNIHNLNRLEHLTHKLQVPQWEKVFAGDQKMAVKHTLADAGKGIYEAKCQHCHTAGSMVGPENNLYSYNVIALEHIGTDEMAAHNCVAPVQGAVFGVTIYNSTEAVKSRYYERWNISKPEQEALEFRSLRGQEFFRDTLLGFQDQNKFGNNYGDIEKGAGYMARHLAGIWATAPYLHNGSVPNMWELLKPAKDRVKIFEVGRRDYNPQTLGFVSQREVNDDMRPLPCAKGEETCFDTSVVGNHNTGHEYATDLSRDEKLALIEYLKVLPPESKYSWQ